MGEEGESKLHAWVEEQVDEVGKANLKQRYVILAQWKNLMSYPPDTN